MDRFDPENDQLKKTAAMTLQRLSDPVDFIIYMLILKPDDGGVMFDTLNREVKNIYDGPASRGIIAVWQTGGQNAVFKNSHGSFQKS